MTTATQAKVKKARRSAQSDAVMNEASANSTTIMNADTSARVVMFYIPTDEQVTDGPIMRGHLEIDVEGQTEPVKVNVAGWLKHGRDSGKPYMGIKVGTNTKEHPEVYSVGPYHGRMFKQVEEKATGAKVRYFGFIEDSVKTGEDDEGRGIYTVKWQLRINAKPQVSGDGKTRYLSGTVVPNREIAGADDLPF